MTFFLLPSLGIWASVVLSIQWAWSGWHSCVSVIDFIYILSDNFLPSVFSSLSGTLLSEIDPLKSYIFSPTFHLLIFSTLEDFLDFIFIQFFGMYIILFKNLPMVLLIKASHFYDTNLFSL